MVQTDEHLLTVCRYVERNALRAKLVDRAEAWRWSSLWQTEYGDAQQKALVSEWPIARPTDWVGCVNADEGEGELRRLRQSVVRSRPFGELEWVTAMIERFGRADILVANAGVPGKSS